VISGSNLENILTSGGFAVTGELGPPKNGDYELVAQKAKILKGYVDAVNITDCQTAIVRMSSLTAGLITMGEGLEVVMQMTCRDRNRIGIQSEVLGASALGIKNLLCLTGDHQKFGNHPQAKGVFDLDSIQLLSMVKTMRDEKKFQGGEEIKSHQPKLFLGCAANPFADPFEFRPVRLAKKVAAGADFVQTQIIYNLEKFKKFMEIAGDLGLHEKCYILAGITPPKSVGMARYMKNNVPGLDVPDEIIERLKGAKDAKEEGINIAVDIINEVRQIPGVKGVHIMAIEWESAVPEIVKRAGLEKRPEPKIEQPPLISATASKEVIELTVKNAVDSARAEIISDAEKIKKQAEAAQELFNKEKTTLNNEIASLKSDILTLNKKNTDKDSEIKNLNDMILSLKEQLSSAKTAQQDVSVIQQQVSQQITEEFKWGGEMTQREQFVLDSISSGLDSLRKALGLNEDQFEAIKKFLQAQFILYSSSSLSAAFVPGAQDLKQQVLSHPVAAPLPAHSEEAIVKPVISPEEESKKKQLTNLIAKANVCFHKNDIKGAISSFEEALVIDPDDLRAKEGFLKAKSLMPKEEPVQAAPAELSDILPLCPPEVSLDEWKTKWVIRYVGIGNVCLSKGDKNGAIEAFNKALKLDSNDEKAQKFLKIAQSSELTDVKPLESVEKPAEVVVTEPAPVSEKKAEAKPEKPAEPAQVKPESKTVAPAEKLSVEIATGDLVNEAQSLLSRAGKIDSSLFTEKYSGTVKGVKFGDGSKALVVGDETTMPFHVFEGNMQNSPVIAFEVLDSPPEDWPNALLGYYSDVVNDPVAWAKKCVAQYNAKSICLSLVSTDPNGMNKPSKEGAQIAKNVIDAVDVPVIIWGCGNAEKDTETLREITGIVPNKRIIMSPITDANYRSIGATAMGMDLPIVAATPIDVNLAKQLNILLNNLGLPLNNILMDPSIGAVGYGLEYTYSVMERIRLAALSGGDDKLAAPFICNLGREVWKTKECKLPTDDKLGDQEKRGIMLEAITAATLLLAGGELMIMRHPKAVSLVNSLIKSLV